MSAAAPHGPPSSPFKGLAAFGDSELDALFFFGREREIEIIAANLVASRFTVLYGRSGVGKSSIMSAGVVRRVRALAPDALVVVHREWNDDPLQTLAEHAGLGLGPASGGSFADRIADRAAGLGSDIYLILDQFEDVFLHRRASPLVHALGEIATRDGLRAHVLVGIREDSLAELDAFSGSLPNVFANHLPLDPLGREAAQSAIVGPIARFAELAPAEAVGIDPDLVEAVLDQVGVGRVALDGIPRGTVASVHVDAVEAAYLQLVMQRLWDAERARGSRTLRRGTLDELGGAREIVRSHLETALGGLTADEQEVAARIFLHLVTPSGGTIPHRAEDLAQYAGVREEDARRVLGELAPRRVVRPLDGRFELFHGVLADAVLSWRTRYEARRALDEQRAGARRRQRRLVAAVAVSLLALAVMTAITAYALDQRSTARAEASQARARTLDAVASALIPVAPARIDPELGLLLAARAARLAPAPPADDILRRALLVSFLRRVLPDRDVAAAAFDRNATRLAVGTTRGDARVYADDLRTVLVDVRVGAPVIGVAVSPDGRRLLTIERGAPATVWDVTTGRALARIGRAPTQAAFSPDGRLVLTVERRELGISHAADGSAAAVIRQPRPIRMAAFAPSGDRIVVAAGRFARVFRVRGGHAVAVADHGATVTSALLTADGRELITAGSDGVVRIWAIGGRVRLVHELSGQRGPVTALALSPDGTLLISASTDGSGAVWDTATGGHLRDLLGHTNHVTGVAFDPTGSWAVTWSKDGTARVWNPSTGATVAGLVAGSEPVTSASFGAGGVVLTTSEDGRVRIWQPPVEPQLRALARLASPAQAAAFSADGRVAAVASRSGVSLFAPDGHLLGRLAVRHVRAVAVDAAGRRVAAVAGNIVTVWRTSDRGIDAEYADLQKPRVVAFSPDGRTIAIGTSAGIVRLRTLHDGDVATLEARDAAVTSLAFSHDGDLIGAGFADGALAVWQRAAARPLFQRIAHRAGTPVLGVAFSRSDRRIATTGQDTQVRVWATADGRPIADLRGHYALVSGAAFSPDGRWLVSAGPGTAGLWDLANRQRLLFLTGHKGRLLAVTFDAAGRRIETIGADGTLRSFSCDICGGIPELIRLADRRLVATGRRLTPAEAKRFLGG